LTGFANGFVVRSGEEKDSVNFLTCLESSTETVKMKERITLGWRDRNHDLGS
jgi:hypothetical protein